MRCFLASIILTDQSANLDWVDQGCLTTIDRLLWDGESGMAFVTVRNLYLFAVVVWMVIASQGAILGMAMVCTGSDPAEAFHVMKAFLEVATCMAGGIGLVTLFAEKKFGLTDASGVNDDVTTSKSFVDFVLEWALPSDFSALIR